MKYFSTCRSNSWPTFLFFTIWCYQPIYDCPKHSNSSSNRKRLMVAPRSVTPLVSMDVEMKEASVNIVTVSHTSRVFVICFSIRLYLSFWAREGVSQVIAIDWKYLRQSDASLASLLYRAALGTRACPLLPIKHPPGHRGGHIPSFDQHPYAVVEAQAMCSHQRVFVVHISSARIEPRSSECFGDKSYRTRIPRSAS